MEFEGLRANSGTRALNHVLNEGFGANNGMRIHQNSEADSHSVNKGKTRF